eukprot:4924290-Prymnesium_polylepis.4
MMPKTGSSSETLTNANNQTLLEKCTTSASAKLAMTTRHVQMIIPKKRKVSARRPSRGDGRGAGGVT